ncbi:MAG: DNA polymerase I [Clostridia bacterium]|nr:DNA polymerase I [Clostridia bacterium]
MKDKRIVVIDGNSLINRAFYALPPLMNKEGLYTNAVYGFANMLNKIVEEYTPKYLAVAFDKKAPTFRHKEFADYKAGRKKMPLELAQQMPLLKELLEYMNISIIELDGFEADDLIGTIVKKAEEVDMEPVVITGDKDALQLASDKTQIIITRKGISEFEAYDQNAFEEKYGITPEQFIDLKGLMGDQSDNIPGVPGIGEKTGLKLIQAFGSVNNLIENLDQIKSVKQREKLEENAQLAVMSRRLAEINVNVPVDISFEEYTFNRPDTEKLITFYNKLEFYSLISKIKKSQSESEESGTVNIDDIKTHMVNNKEELHAIKEMLQPNDEVIIKIFSDASHMRASSVSGISLLIQDTYIYFQLNEVILDEVVTLLNDCHLKITGHDLKKEVFVLLHLGVENFDISFDTAIAQYLIQPERRNYNLNDLALEYFNVKMDEMTENSQLEFFSDTNKENFNIGLQWCSVTAEIRDVLKEKLKSEDLTELYYNIELPLVEVLAQMEFSGFTVDKDTLIVTGEKLKADIEIISGKIYDLAGENFNINSPKQLGPILFEKLDLPFAKKTKTGYSTSVDVLEKLKDKHDIIPQIMEYRTLNKLKTTYIDGLLPLINPHTHKIHAHFNQTVTTTGRISCTEPNLQNIPIKQEAGRLLRKAFIAEDDYVLMGADYSQIELRVLAHLSNDPTLIEAFMTDQDIHTITASKVFDVDPSEVTSLQRSNAKAVNFGVIYGMSDYGLSENLHITRKEAAQYIDEYFKKYSTVKDFMDKMIEMCKEKGYVTTIMNRKRHVPEITSRNYNIRSFGERLAMNTPIQGSAADLIKIAMIDVYNALKEKKVRSKLILQVHDELILNVHKDEIDMIKDILVEKMEKAYTLSVPLKVDLNIGSNWYELK